MSSIRFNGNYEVQLNAGSKWAQELANFLYAYNKRAGAVLELTTPVTNQLVTTNGLTNPAIIIIRCISGSVDIAFDNSGSAGTGKLTLNMNTTPAPNTDNPAFFVYKTNGPNANKVYLTAATPTVVSIDMFE